MAYTESSSGTRDRSTRAVRGIESTTTQAATGQSRQFYEIEVAEVVDVVLNEDHPSFLSARDIGKAKFRFVRSQRDKPEEELRFAKPYDSNIQKYPLIGELVVCARYLGEYYYLAVLPVRESVNHNAFQGVSTSPRSDSAQSVRENQAGLPDAAGDGRQRLGDRFSPDPAPKPLVPDEGDVVLQGRFGNTIRMGSTSDGGATMLMRAGQSSDADSAEERTRVREDVNGDAASLYLTDGLTVRLENATAGSEAEHRSVEDAPTEYGGRQAVLTSERVVINGRSRVFSYSAEGTHHQSARDVTVDAGRDILMSTLRDLRRVVDGEQYATVSDRAVWEVPEMRMGAEDADEPLVLGQRFVDFAEQLVQYISTHTHPHPIAPTGPPVQPTQPVSNLIQPTQSQRNFTV